MNALVMTSPFWMAVIPSSIIHLVLNMSASCISSSHDFINVCKISTLSCVWDVKKEMCKVQEVSSGFWVTKYHLRIITKLEVTLKSPSSLDPWFYVSVMALHHWQWMRIPALFSFCFHTFEQLGLSLHTFSIHPQGLPPWMLQFFTWAFLSPLAAFCWGNFPSPPSAVPSKPQQLPFRQGYLWRLFPFSIFFEITLFQSRQRQCLILDPPHATW